jgi:hypothetical protein
MSAMDNASKNAGMSCQIWRDKLLKLFILRWNDFKTNIIL